MLGLRLSLKQLVETRAGKRCFCSWFFWGSVGDSPQSSADRVDAESAVWLWLGRAIFMSVSHLEKIQSRLPLPASASRLRSQVSSLTFRPLTLPPVSSLQQFAVRFFNYQFCVPLALLALFFAPTRLIEEANPEWRLVSWALAIEVVGLTLLLVYFVAGPPALKRFALPSLIFWSPCPGQLLWKAIDSRPHPRDAGATWMCWAGWEYPSWRTAMSLKWRRARWALTKPAAASGRFRPH